MTSSLSDIQHLNTRTLRDVCLTMSPVQADKLSTLIKAAGVDVEPFWPGLFSKALEGQF